MININRNDITEIEYQIEVEGLNLNDISQIRFSIHRDDHIHSILGNIIQNKVYFKINPFSLECKTYEFCIEVVTNHYLFKVIEDSMNIIESMKVKLIGDNGIQITETKKPIVKLKL